MFLFAQLIGLLIASIGLATALRPQIFPEMIAYWEKDRRFYRGAIFRLLFAGILLTATPDTRMPAVILILGVLFLCSGILVYALPEEKILAIIGWCKARPVIFMRAWGVVAALLGILIVFAA